MEESDFISIGRIVKNQGNKGELRVVPLTDFPERFQLLERVFLKQNGDLLEKRIENLRYHKKFVILKLDGVNNIEEALGLKDSLVQIPGDEILELEEGHFYIDQLIGFNVITVENKYLGELTSIITTGGTDVYRVDGEEKEYMIPAAKEIITQIDIETSTIIIDPIPGLLEL